MFKIIHLGYEHAKTEVILTSLIQVLLMPLPLIQAYIAKLIMDQISLKIQGQGGDVNLVLFYLFLEFLTMVLPSAINVWTTKLNNSFKMKNDLMFKEKLFKKLNTLDYEFFEDSQTQNQLHEIRFQMNVTADSIMSSFFSVAQGLFIIFSFFGLLLSHNVFVAVALLIVALITFYVNYKGKKESIEDEKARIRDYRYLWFLESTLVESRSVKEVKTLNVGNYFIEKYKQLQAKTISERNKKDEELSRNSAIMGAASSALYYLSYGWIVLQTIKGSLSLGDMTMFLMLFTKAQGGLSSVFSSFVRLYESQVKIKLSFDFWNMPEKRTGSATPEEFEKAKSDFSIEFKNVTFSYPGSSKNIIENFNLFLKAGQKVALVGENGAGKSSIIKLLLGLYEPQEGEILVGGINLKKFSRTQIKELMGAVFQDYMTIMGESFKGNIVVGELGATDEEYSFSKKHSGVDKMLEEIGKDDSEILGSSLTKRGSELSGGQWQKIALARAFIQKGRILILDEPTSAIDAKQEHEIFKKFQDLTQGKTTLLVSHRFSTVRMADLIVYMENGKIVEQGSHQELLARDGEYAKMFNMQAQGYL